MKFEVWQGSLWSFPKESALQSVEVEHQALLWLQRLIGHRPKLHPTSPGGRKKHMLSPLLWRTLTTGTAILDKHSSRWKGKTHFMWQKNMAQTSDAEGTSCCIVCFLILRTLDAELATFRTSENRGHTENHWQKYGRILLYLIYFPSHDMILHPSHLPLKRSQIKGQNWGFHPSIPIRTCCFAIEAWFSSLNWCSMACRKRRGIEMIFNDVYWLHSMESFRVLCSRNKFCMSYHPAMKAKGFQPWACWQCASCHCFASSKCISCSLGKRNNAHCTVSFWAGFTGCLASWMTDGRTGIHMVTNELHGICPTNQKSW